MTDIKNRILSLVNSGKTGEAKRKCLAACQKNSTNAELWFILSAICGQTQDYSAAEKYISKAIRLNPSVPTAYYNLAIAQKAQNKVDEAVSSFEKSVQLQGNLVASIFELGNIYLQKKEYVRAIDYYRKVISYSSTAFQAHSNLAIAYDGEGDTESAISAYVESLRLKSDQPEVLARLAFMYDKLGDVDKAIFNYERSVNLGNIEADIFINLGRMYDIKGDMETAGNLYKKALSVDSDSVEALTNLALLCEKIRETDRALEYIEKANKIGSDDARFIYNRAKILASAQKYTEAKELYGQVLDNNPEFCEAAVNLGNLYLMSGKALEAHVIYSRACEINPGFHDACSNMLMSLNYAEQYSAAKIRDMHYSWANRFESEVDRIKINHDSYDTDRPLRIGYISADFRDHSVAYFLDGILKFSDKSKITNYCYSDVFNKDMVTKRLESYVDNWRDVSMLDDESLAEIIQRDKIDVLIDLCGHTSGNRLPVFALKPAPIQITYLGYPNTTGLKAMDYRIVDKITDPEGSGDMMSESPLYIDPCFLSYTPPFKDEPKVSELPAIDNGYITFASFNNLAKISDDVIEAWSKIILATPGSKLCLKARQFSDLKIKNEYIEQFQRVGIDSKRLILLSSTKTTREHLQVYNSIDIALDTFPYNGTTTTFEALWMGVPVICFSGTCHASRVSSTVIRALGVNTLVAKDQQQYVSIACDLANNLEVLVTLRNELRIKMSQSVLLDGEQFTRKFETALLAVSSHNAKVN